MFGLIRKRRVADVPGEMRWRASKEGYVRKEAQGAYSFALDDVHGWRRLPRMTLPRRQASGKIGDDNH